MLNPVDLKWGAPQECTCTTQNHAAFNCGGAQRLLQTHQFYYTIHYKTPKYILLYSSSTQAQARPLSLLQYLGVSGTYLTPLLTQFHSIITSCSMHSSSSPTQRLLVTICLPFYFFAQICRILV